MVVEDGMEGVGVGWVKNADNPITVVLELIACDTSPIIRLLHGMRIERWKLSCAGGCGGRRACSSPQGVGVTVCALRARCFSIGRVR